MNAVHLDVDRENVPIPTEVVGRPRRDVEVLLPEPDRERNLRRGLVGEVEPDAGLHDLRLPARHQVHLEEHVGARVQAPGHPFGNQRPVLPGRPAQQMAEGKLCVERRDVVEAGFGVSRVERSGGRCRIEPHVGVVDDSGVRCPRGAGAPDRRLELEALHEPRLSNRDRDRELAEDIVPVGPQREGLGHFDDEVRLAEPPCAEPLRYRREVGRVSCGRPGIDPPGDQIDLAVAQPPVADERTAVPRLRLPWRHRPGRGRLPDGASPWPGVVVGQEAERSGGAGAVTGGAVPEDEWCDIPVERDGIGRVCRRGESFTPLSRRRLCDRCEARCHDQSDGRSDGSEHAPRAAVDRTFEQPSRHRTTLILLPARNRRQPSDRGATGSVRATRRPPRPPAPPSPAPPTASWPWSSCPRGTRTRTAAHPCGSSAPARSRAPPSSSDR